MGRISSLFAHKVVGIATEGLPPDHPRRQALLGLVGIDANAPIDPKQMIEDAAYYSLCERVDGEQQGSPALTLRVGGTMRCDDYGAFGLAFKSAPDLLGSYRRGERYGRVLTSVSTHRLVAEGTRSLFLLHRVGERRRGLEMSNEQTMAAIMRISQEVCQARFVPEAVFFRHDPPASLAEYEAFFGSPVQFRAEYDAIAVSNALLAAPNRLGDARIAEFFDAHMERELAALADEAGLVQRVRIQVSQALSEGVPAIAATARRLGMSGRTLQRRLGAAGLSYQDLVEQARRELAERLLARTTYSLAEIAFLTGYAEQSTFSRAFKRWRGLSPARFRRAAKAA
ncbi:MAG: AraC family transcriptional regulator ligand-binding domain-containing protein [Pseudomonadota bacterium]